MLTKNLFKFFGVVVLVIFLYGVFDWVVYNKMFVSDGMSGYVKYNIMSDKPFDLKIVDHNNMVKASLINGIDSGFDEPQYSISSNETPGFYTADLYVRNNGVKVITSCGSDMDVPIDFRVYVSTLDVGGNKTATATYTATKTSASGLVLSFNMLPTVTQVNLANLVENQVGDLKIRPMDWFLPETLDMNLNDVVELDVTGTDASFAKENLNWNSSDETVASVVNGVVTAKSYGTTTISVFNDDRSEACDVTVVRDVDSLQLSDMTIFVDRRGISKPIFTPMNATEKDVTYTTTNLDIINIKDDGVFVGVKPSVATVTGTTENGISDTFTITVTNR